MPEPKDVHVDGVLSNVSIAYRNPGFIADALSPRIPVGKKSHKYPVYGKERFSILETLRAPRTVAREVDWTVTWPAYFCEEHALQEAIDDQERENADAPINVEVDTTEFLTDLLGVAREKRVADLCTDATVITQNTTLSGTDQWSDAANSDPVGDVATARTTILQATGMAPNTVVLSQEVLDALKAHDDIVDRIKYSQLGVLTTDLLQQLFEVENVLVGQSVYNTAAEGQAASLSAIWPDTVIVAHVVPGPALKRPRLSGTMTWRQRQVETWREEARKSDLIRVAENVDEVIMCAEAGYLIIDALA